MNFDTSYEICSPAVMSEDFDGETVILNLEDGRYFSLRGSGNDVWNALMAGSAPRSIVTSVRRVRADWEVATTEFLQRLVALGLIRPTVTSTSGATRNDDESSSVTWSSTANGDEPGIDVFEDLAELILADPIHDVDADEGWPIRKAA